MMWLLLIVLVLTNVATFVMACVRHEQALDAETRAIQAEAGFVPHDGVHDLSASPIDGYWDIPGETS